MAPRTRFTMSHVIAVAAGMAAAGILMVAATTPLLAAEAQMTVKDVTTPLASVSFSTGKTIAFTWVLGSGAFHPKGEAGILYTISDVGPSVACKEAKDIVGANQKALCKGDKDGKIVAIPDFAPTIFKLRLNNGTVEIVERIALKDKDGKAVSGLPVPVKNGTVNAYDKNGAPLAKDPNGVDPEAVVRLADGTFWVGDEAVPSLLHVAADGRIVERLVPEGMAGDLAGASVAVREALPAIVKLRKINRGIEAVAVSPDEKFLYYAIQSPLVNPNDDAFKTSRMVRIFKMDRASTRTVGEYVYVLDPPGDFVLDNSAKPSDVKVSEMQAVGDDELVVLERLSKTTKLYRVSLKAATNILGTAWDKSDTKPTLEQTTPTGLQDKGIAPVAKALFFDSYKFPEMPSEVEGLAFLEDGSFVLINDNDYGLDGAATKLMIVRPGDEMSAGPLWERNVVKWRPLREIVSREFKFLVDPKFFAGGREAGFKAVWEKVKAAAAKEGFTLTDGKKGLKEAASTKEYFDTPDFKLRKAGYIIRVSTKYAEGKPVYPFTMTVKELSPDNLYRILGSKLAIAKGYKVVSGNEENISISADGSLNGYIESAWEVKLKPEDIGARTVGDFGKIFPALLDAGLPADTKLQPKGAFAYKVVPGTLHLDGGVDVEIEMEGWAATADGPIYLGEVSFSLETPDYYAMAKTHASAERFLQVCLGKDAAELKLANGERWAGSKVLFLLNLPN